MASSFLSILFLAMSSLAFASMQPNDVHQTLASLKIQVSQYQQFEDNQDWLAQFQKFLSKKIVESPEKHPLIVTACAPWKDSFYQECVNGAFSFYKTSVGLSNAIEVFQRECQNDEKSSICALYRRMINQDVAQLKFILQL